MLLYICCHVNIKKKRFVVAAGTPQGNHDMIVSDLVLWKKLIKDAKISVDVLP
jgi:hypothetical protein